MAVESDAQTSVSATKREPVRRLPPVGFWSYARQDDALSQGSLTALRALLARELQQQYGREPVRLFQDMNAIAHGSDWEREITKALDQSTFFIPILTPNFIQSEWCCREVELFLAREAGLRSSHPDLADSSRIFPILFIGIDDVEPEDPAILAALEARQWFDFRHYRHRSLDEPEVRESLSRLAANMRALLKTKLSGMSDAGAEPAPPTNIDAPTIAMPVVAKDKAPAQPPAAAGQLSVGARLNNIFEVKRFIKAGGMGQVFEGANVMTGERVAIKTLLPALAADPRITALFQREAMTLTRLNHEALVQYRVIAEEPALGVLYLVTEYIDGTDLADALGGMDRGEPELRRLLGRLASGLAAAHRLGAIHRDISPDNIMLPGSDVHQAKIIDFGIAKDLGGAMTTLIGDGFAGKLSYVAPEQLGEHGGEIGPWTDVYSLGLVILSAANGAKMDMGGSFADAIRKRREMPDLTAAPEGLRPLLADMLRLDPAQRLRSMDAVLERLNAPAAPAAPIMSTPALSEAAAPSSPAASPPNLSPANAGKKGRSTAWRWLAVGVVLAAALVLFLLLRPGEGGRSATVASPAATTRSPTVAPALASQRPAQAQWIADRWCLVDRATGRRLAWTITRQGNRMVTTLPDGRYEETVRRESANELVTNDATYRLDPDGHIMTVRETHGETTRLEHCG
jgi:serine/threonine protein kinase